MGSLHLLSLLTLALKLRRFIYTAKPEASVRTVGRPAKPGDGAPFSMVSNSPSHGGSENWSPGRATVDRLGGKEHFITNKPIRAAPPIPEHFYILFPLSCSGLQHHCWSLSAGCFSTQSSQQRQAQPMQTAAHEKQAQHKQTRFKDSQWPEWRGRQE